MKRILILCGLLLVLPLPAIGQAPAFHEVTGHQFGERITRHAQMMRYLERLAEASPRVTIQQQGHSWEGRELMLAIVTSPENHARLEEIRRNAQRLADPRTTSPAQAAALIATQPAIIWFGGSIHGFELSGSEGALRLLEHLTTRDDEATLEVLRNTVVLIDPILNPDGRDAFASHNHQALGNRPNPRPEDWSNDFTGWQGVGFRTSHYYFDINRDWFAHTHPETRFRVPTLLAWQPQAAVDMHEMGADAEFYFDPPGSPVNPFFPEHSSRWFQRFGDAHAAAFDRAGYEYMTGERYNFFFPGYTTAYTNYLGAVGLLYEQGSSRGLALERPDRSVRTLRDALDQQYTAAWAATSLAARERQTLLNDFYESHRAAVADGARGARRYILAPEGDPGLVAELVNLLRRGGVEVQRTTEPARLSGVRDRAGATVGARTFPAGSYVIEAAQPRNRLARVLLEPSVPVPEEFLREARGRVERAENPRFYDITAWSLPLLFDVGGYSSTDARRIAAEPVAAEVRVAQPPARNAGYAYLIDGSQAAGVSVLYHLLEAGHRVAVTLKPTQVGGERVSSGTVVVRVGQNEEGVHEAVRDAAQRFDVRVRAVDTGMGDAGFLALGSGDVISVRRPEIAILAEDPVQGYSFGWAWHTLDQAYGIPATVLRTRSLNSAALARFDVLVVPEVSGAALARLLGDDGVAQLRQWVRDGGTLVTLGAATDFARDQLELIRLRSWYDTAAGENTAQRISVPGAIVRAQLDPESWLSAGYPDAELPILVTSDRVYLSPDGPVAAGRRTVATYAPGDRLHLSGHLWPESRERLPGAVPVYEERVGRGRVIAFAEDPNFRGYWRGTDRLFLNAVIIGPSAP
ncbi:MAG: hypothetical protein H0X65_04105 [Gemmatimonadetes bacterium]|nr:hypothetical protein [Gemmatimonadota bacterium]